MSSAPPVLSCPLPSEPNDDRIPLAVGDGGPTFRAFLARTLLENLGNPILAELADSARLPHPQGQILFTTDSFVVSPVEFPGGDLGRLAVCGTINDLVVAGARPRWLSLSLLIEEGFSATLLTRLVASLAAEAQAHAVPVVTGDTKVLPRGSLDGLFINMAGIGEACEPLPPGPRELHVGDRLLATGPPGLHGLAVLAAREGIAFDPPLESDLQSLWPAAEALRQARIPVRAMRDATRGGVAAVLHEWAMACGHSLLVHEKQFPTHAAARGASELLGINLLHVACEGMMLVAVPAESAQAALAALRQVTLAAHAEIIGEVIPQTARRVVIERTSGRQVPLDEPRTTLLPRIC